MKGNKLCLCFLLAAGVGLGAHAQNKIAAPMKDVNQVVDNTLDSLNVARSARPVSGSSRKGIIRCCSLLEIQRCVPVLWAMEITVNGDGDILNTSILMKIR